MWPFRSPEQPQPEPTSKGISPFTSEHARSERNWGRFSRFLKVWFVAHMAAYPVREELYVVAGNVPRMVEKALSERDPEAQAKKLLEQYKQEIESGEPIPIDLLTFYLEQEKESAGVTDEEILIAKRKFEEIVGKAGEIKAKGNSRAEVVGYVLKQQGDYDTSSSLMTDLLVSGKGECEARQRYISAAYQRLYPDDVQKGKMKSETFRPWVDKQGLFHPGHVRVVIDQGERVEVLEGDAIKSEPKNQHDKITKTDTTRLAVTGYAAKEGLYNLDEGSKVKPPSVTQQVERALKGSHKLESLQEAIHSVATDNSVAAYPTAATTYGREGVGTRNVDPHPVGNSWAPSRYDWAKAIELTLIEPHPELTMENIDRAINKQSGYFELEKFEIIDPAVMEALVEKRQQKISEPPERDRHPFYIRGDQKLPVEALKNQPNEFAIRNGSAIPKELESIPVKRLALYDVEKIPSNVGRVDWISNAHLFITVAGDGDIDPENHLRNLTTSLHEGKLTIRRIPLKTKSGRSIMTAESFDGLAIDQVNVDGVDVQWFGTLISREIFYRGYTQEGQFQSVTSNYVSVQYNDDKQVTDLPFYVENTNGIKHGSVLTAELIGLTYGPKAFSHVPFNTLISRVGGSVAPDTFKDAQIGRVILGQDPFTAFPIAKWEAPDVVGADPFITRGVDMLIFSPAQNGLDTLDQTAQSGDGKIQPSMSYLEQVKFLREWNLVHPAVKVVIVSGDAIEALKNKYGGYHLIPDSAYLKADYLHGEGNVTTAFERSQ